mgnify:CR=1 FL=1
MSDNSKIFKERMSDFFSEPSSPELRQVLKDFDSEFQDLDYKEEYIDKTQLAKHIMAMMNSGGGVIVFGVTDNGEPKGLEETKDESELQAQLNKYLPEEIEGKYYILTYNYEETEWGKLQGKSCQIILIEYDKSVLPVVNQSDAKALREGDIYTRNKSSSERATYHQVQQIIEERIAYERNKPTEKLEEHFEELKYLYSHYPNVPQEGSIQAQLQKSLPNIAGKKDLGRQEFLQFVQEMAEEKKEQIRELLAHNSN